MKAKTIKQDACSSLTAAELQQIQGGGKGFISMIPGMFPPGLIVTPFAPICGTSPVIEPDGGIIFY